VTGQTGVEIAGDSTQTTPLRQSPAASPFLAAFLKTLRLNYSMLRSAAPSQWRVGAWRGRTLPLRVVDVRTDLVLRDGDLIVRQTVVVETVSIFVAELFIGGTVAFDRALVHVLIVVRRVFWM
jgi:hypothetical protein